MLNQPGQVKLSLLLLHLALCQSTSGLCLHPHTFLTRSSRHVLRNCSSQIPRGAFPVLHSPLTAVTNPAQAATPAHTAAEGHEPILIFIPPFQTFHDQSASKKSICTPATELQPQKAGLSPLPRIKFHILDTGMLQSLPTHLHCTRTSSFLQPYQTSCPGWKSSSPTLHAENKPETSATFFWDRTTRSKRTNGSR